MIDLKLTNREIPIEERPPGRGRGSSVCMLVGYLIGLSHIDPLHFDLSLERFLPDDEISNVNIPTCIPLAFNVSLKSDEMTVKRIGYLADKKHVLNATKEVAQQSQINNFQSTKIDLIMS